MPLFPFPSQAALLSSFSQHPLKHQFQPHPKPNKSYEPFSAWSAIEDADKKHGGGFAGGVQSEWSKLSQKAQAKAGKIELYSGKYYAVCTVAGLLACVCFFNPTDTEELKLTRLGPDAYGGYPAGSGQMSAAGRCQPLQEQH